MSKSRRKRGREVWSLHYVPVYIYIYSSLYIYIYSSSLYIYIDPLSVYIYKYLQCMDATWWLKTGNKHILKNHHQDLVTIYISSHKPCVQKTYSCITGTDLFLNSVKSSQNSVKIKPNKVGCKYAVLN